jgi:D-alanyl-D-alanine carboxypeptidase
LLTVDELLQAAMMTSANDAVEVIKEGVDNKYHEAVFVRAMNEKSQALGLHHSSFANPQGFDDQKNFSSVEDLAVLTHYALTNYPRIAEIVKKDYTILAESNSHKKFDLYNWNGLIGVYPEIIGMKIGNTDQAGKTTIVISQREGKKLLVILLGAPGLYERDLWAADLLDLGYQRTKQLEPIAVTREQLKNKYESWQYWE